MIQHCPLLPWLSKNGWQVKQSAGFLVLNALRFHRPTFVLLVGPCRFHFSQAVASSRPPGCFMLLNRKLTHSSWLLWQSPYPGQCLDPSLTSLHAFPFPLSFFFIFLLQLLCEDKIHNHRSNTTLFLLSTNALSC